MNEKISRISIIGIFCNIITFCGIVFITWFIFDELWIIIGIKQTIPNLMYNLPRPVIGTLFIVISYSLRKWYNVNTIQNIF